LTLAGFTYRGLSPHKFTPVPGVHQSLHLTANSSAVFERLCPASKQVVIQGSVLRSVGGR